MALQSNRVKCKRCGHINPPGLKKCETCDVPLVVAKVALNPSPRSANAAPSPQDQMRQIFFRRGQIVANRYTVMDMIGRGGMGCIYKVFDNTLKEEVALKTLLPQFARDKLVVERFYNEARIARTLSHPSIVRVHDIGIDGDVLYISMELLDGKSLRAIMDALPKDNRLPIPKVLQIFDALCAALEYAHQYTVHRDIKPENVMIAPDGAVKLMDFGISKLVTHTSLTATSVVMGTPHYMSPEQLKDSANVDGRADIYSVGVMLYEVTTGNVPTGVPKPASQIQSEVPQRIDTIIAKCLEPDPAKRYATAEALRKELRETYDKITGVAKLETDVDPLHKKKKKAASGGNGLRIASGIAGIALVIGAAVWGASVVEARLGGTPDAIIDTMPPPSGGQSAQGLPSWDVVKATAERARAHASRTPVPNKKAVIAAGDAAWEAAQESRDSGANDVAYEFARDALQCFNAAKFMENYPDMTFVWSGEVELRDREETVRTYVDAFLIDEHEVTLDEYRQFCDQVDGGWTSPQARISQIGRGREPVTNVTLYDAMAYAAFNIKQIPTEAQWARAAYNNPSDDGTPPDFFPWGTQFEPPSAPDPQTGTPQPEHKGQQTGDAAPQNAAGSMPRANVLRDGSGVLYPVNSFKSDRSSVFSLADVVGNAAEWTCTPYGSIANGIAAAEQATPESTPSLDSSYVVRGGDYAREPQPLYTRYGLPYIARHPTVGFRCVVPVPTDMATLIALTPK